MRRERNESGGDGVMRVEFCLKGRDRLGGGEEMEEDREDIRLRAY